MIYFPSSHMIEQIRRGEFGALFEAVDKYNVQTLDFSRKDVDAQTAKMIAQAVKGMPIKGLNMGYNHFGRAGAIAVIEQLKTAQISELDLSGNYIASDVIEVIRLLGQTSIKALKLAYNHIKGSELRRVESMASTMNVDVDVSNNLSWL